MVRDKGANVQKDANQSVTGAANGRKTAKRPIQETHPSRSLVLLQVFSCSKEVLPVSGLGVRLRVPVKTSSIVTDAVSIKVN